MVKISALTLDSAPTATDSIPTYDAEGNATKRITIQSLIDLVGSASGYSSFLQSASVSSGYNKGQKEHDITFSGSVSGILSPGMRFKVDRGTTPPTQCTDLENSSSQFASKTTPSGITFTDDYTLEAWIKVESYVQGYIISKSTATNGFAMYMDATGRIDIFGVSGGSARDAITYQSIPLGVWTHVAATMDMSAGSGHVYINGVDVAVSISGAATALTQAGNMEIGARVGATFFDGKIADARVWNVVRTATQIRDNMNQQLTGSETNLNGYWKLNGNFNDSTSNANNLTASGSATATSTDNPMNSTEYGIIVKVNGATATVFTGTDWNIPNMTLNSPYYSTLKSPYGFQAQRSKWIAQTLYLAAETIAFGGINAWTDSHLQLSVPTGCWNLSYSVIMQLHSTVSGGREGTVCLKDATYLPATNAVFKNPLTSHMPYVSGNDAIGNVISQTNLDMTTSSVFTISVSIASSSGGESYVIAYSNKYCVVVAECAYI